MILCTHLHSPTTEDEILTFRYWFQIYVGVRRHNLTRNIAIYERVDAI